MGVSSISNTRQPGARVCASSTSRATSARSSTRSSIPPGSFVPSPDGRYLAYQSYEIDGAPVAGLFTIPLDSATGLLSPGAAPTQVASGYPSFCWSPDSRSLIYSPGDGVHEVSVNGRDRRVLVDAPFSEYRDNESASVARRPLAPLVRQSAREAASDSGYLYVARRDGTESLQVGYGQRPLWVNGDLGDVEEADPPPAPNPLDRPLEI